MPNPCDLITSRTVAAGWMIVHMRTYTYFREGDFAGDFELSAMSEKRLENSAQPREYVYINPCKLFAFRSSDDRY